MSFRPSEYGLGCLPACLTRYVCLALTMCVKQGSIPSDSATATPNRRRSTSNTANCSVVGHVTRARFTQIMNLLQLAPDIQEELLFLPRIQRGADPISEPHLQPIVTVPD